MLTSNSLQNLRQAIKECRDCELGAACVVGQYYTPTPSSGPMDAEIMVIARNPGKEEERVGAPLVGPAGILFTQFLEQCGIDRDECYLTNLALCFSTANRPPTTAEYEACAKWKKLEFQLVKPKLVILLGSDCFHFFYPSKKDSPITQEQGNVFDGFEIEGYGKGFKVIVFPHPSYYLRRRTLMAMEWGVAATICREVVRINSIRKGVVNA